MKLKYKILKVRDGSFQGRDGDSISYFWVKAIRLADGVTLEFGSKRGDEFEVDDEPELELQKSEDGRGGYRYKEINSV